jgi:small subunit ribosomal protein S3
MKILLTAERPGLIIGKKGKSIENLTEILKTEYNLENPQIEVVEVPTPYLNPRIMAQRIALELQKGHHFKRAAYSTLNNIMDAGAKGAQVVISGKLHGERACSVKFTKGFIKHAGNISKEITLEFTKNVKTKPGVLGVKVTIIPPEKELKIIKLKEVGGEDGDNKEEGASGTVQEGVKSEASRSTTGTKKKESKTKDTRGPGQSRPDKGDTKNNRKDTHTSI